MELKLISHSRVSKDRKVTVTEEANQVINVVQGDYVAWYRDENGHLILKKANLVPVG